MYDRWRLWVVRVLFGRVAFDLEVMAARNRMRLRAWGEEI